MIAPRFPKIDPWTLSLDPYIPPNTGLEADCIYIRTETGKPLVITGPRCRLEMLESSLNKMVLRPLDSQFKEWYGFVQERIVTEMEDWGDAYILQDYRPDFFDAYIGKFLGFRSSQQSEYHPVLTKFELEDGTTFQWQELSVGDELTPLLRVSGFYHKIFPVPPTHLDTERQLKGVTMEMLRAIVYPKSNGGDDIDWEFDTE